MTTYIHRCLIVPADLAPLARTLTEAVAGPAGAGMFATGLSADGSAPATHYISSGMIEDTFSDMLDDAGVMYEACRELEVDVKLEDCVGILGASDITGEKPFEAMGRLGLQLVNFD